MKVSFIGLGVMGFPMAGHLVKAGFEVTVFNRTHSKALDWADKHQGKAAESVAECVAEADVVLVCVGNDDDVRSMTTSETGALAAMKGLHEFVVSPFFWDKTEHGISPVDTVLEVSGSVDFETGLERDGEMTSKRLAGSGGVSGLQSLDNGHMLVQRNLPTSINGK